jgi:hypothetical protein
MNPLLLIVPLGLLALGGKKSQAPMVAPRPPVATTPIPTQAPLRRVVKITTLDPRKIRAAVQYALNYETDTWNLNNFGRDLVNAGWTSYGDILFEKTNYLDDGKSMSTPSTNYPQGLIMPPPPPPPVRIVRGRAVRTVPTLNGGSMSLTPSMGPLPSGSSGPSSPSGGSGQPSGNQPSSNNQPSQNSNPTPDPPPSTPDTSMSTDDTGTGDN